MFIILKLLHLKDLVIYKTLLLIPSLVLTLPNKLPMSKQIQPTWQVVIPPERYL